MSMTTLIHIWEFLHLVWRICPGGEGRIGVVAAWRGCGNSWLAMNSTHMMGRRLRSCAGS